MNAQDRTSPGLDHGVGVGLRIGLRPGRAGAPLDSRRGFGTRACFVQKRSHGSTGTRDIWVESSVGERPEQRPEQVKVRHSCSARKRRSPSSSSSSSPSPPGSSSSPSDLGECGTSTSHGSPASPDGDLCKRGRMRERRRSSTTLHGLRGYIAPVQIGPR